MASVHSAGGFCPAGADALRAARRRTSRCRPPRGASIFTLLSASCGEMSTWMNFCPPQALWPLPPQVLPLPCESSQFRRAPISITTSASGSTKERAAEAALLVRVGQQALGHRHRQVRDAGLLDERADVGVALRVGRALAEHDERLLRALQQVERALDRVRRRESGCGAGSTTLMSVERPGGGVHRLREELRRQVEVHAARAARDRGADGARDADADVLGVQHAEGGLGDAAWRWRAGPSPRSRPAAGPRSRAPRSR